MIKRKRKQTIKVTDCWLLPWTWIISQYSSPNVWEPKFIHWSYIHQYWWFENSLCIKKNRTKRIEMRIESEFTSKSWKWEINQIRKNIYLRSPFHLEPTSKHLKEDLSYLLSNRAKVLKVLLVCSHNIRLSGKGKREMRCHLIHFSNWIDCSNDCSYDCNYKYK